MPQPGAARTALSPSATDDSHRRLHLKVGGMHCSLCTRSIEKALARLPGVASVQVSLAHSEALVVYDPFRLQPSLVEQALEAIGFSVQLPDEAAALAAENRELRLARRRALAAGGLLAAASALMLAERWAGPAAWLTGTMGLVALLATLGPGRFVIAQNGWQSLRRGILNQDVLASASALGGLGGGIAGLFLPGWPAGGFFGAAVFVLAFHLIGGYTSVLVHVRASQAVRRLMALQPPTAHRVEADGREREVRIEELAVGDLVRVRSGERIAVDGTVVEGTSAVDMSLLTGEPMPRDVGPGDEVVGGTLNQTGGLLVRVTRVGDETFLRAVARLVAEARAMKPGILRLVDRVLLVYVPAVFATSAAGLLLWVFGPWALGGAPDLLRASFAALSVLIMGYPCALGMATPLAMVRASAEAAAHGILMRSGEAFQVFKDVGVVVFDKTGTLTQGKPVLVGIRALDGAENQLLRLAASAELLSDHPLAAAIVRAAREQGLPLSSPSAFEERPGYGVRAEVDGHTVLVGTSRLLVESGVDLTPLRPWADAAWESGQTAVLVSIDGRAAGLLALADPLKPDARDAVEALRRQGVRPVLLTGDHRRSAESAARAAGIDEVRSEVLPGEKAAAIRHLQARGQRVAMVGDGINDAPALMQADVGIAIGTGADIAIEAADVVVMGQRVTAVAAARQLARASYRLTATNVALALAFNGAGVLAAVSGRVHPVWAMLAMAVSVSVVLTRSLAGRLAVRRDPVKGTPAGP